MMRRQMTADELDDWLDESDEAEEEQAEDGEDWDEDDDLGDGEDLGEADDDGDEGEAEDEAAVLVVGEDDDADDEPAPRRGRAEARIHQLTGKARAAEQEAIAERKRRQELERRLQEMERARMSQETESLAAQEREAKAALKSAYDADDVDQITEAHARMTELQLRRARAAAPVETPAGDDEAQAPADNGLPEAAQSWIARNSWFNNPGSERRTELAITINRELLEQGLDVSHPRFYQELDKRMKQKIEAQRGRGRRPNAAGVPRGDSDGEGGGLRDQAGYKNFLVMTGERDSKRMRDAWAKRNELVD
jgi:hypothetical protein